jgi:hypothetical protein
MDPEGDLPTAALISLNPRAPRWAKMSAWDKPEKCNEASDKLYYPLASSQARRVGGGAWLRTESAAAGGATVR